MQEEIVLTRNTKGIITFAQCEGDKNDVWVILIKRIEEDDEGLKIIRHISYDLTNKVIYSDKNYEGNWGHIDGYKFYTATEAQKQIIKNIIKEKGMKYVKVLNKLIHR